jgi:hypothetical protein
MLDGISLDQLRTLIAAVDEGSVLVPQWRRYFIGNWPEPAPDRTFECRTQ